MNFIKQYGKDILFTLLCWTIGFRLLYLTNNKIDITKDNINVFYLLIFASGIILLLLPFFTKIKIGKYIELERKLKDTKEELKDFKAEIRQTIITLNSSISTISSLSNQVTINFPNAEDLKEEIKKIKSKTTVEDTTSIEHELILQEEDRLLALAKARIQIEYLLRKILNKRLSTNNAQKDIRYATLTQLIRDFMKEYPDYKYLEKSFDYTRIIVNSAIHAQRLTDEQVKEGLELSSNIISILKHLADN